MTMNGEDLTLSPPRNARARSCSGQDTTFGHRRGLKSAMKNVANEVHELRDEVAEVKGIGMRVEASVAGIRRLTVPPPRVEMPSGIDLEEFAERAVAAIQEGIASPSKTPEDEVRRLFAEEQSKREAAAIVKASERRSRFLEKLLLAVLGIVLAALLGHFWR